MHKRAKQAAAGGTRLRGRAAKAQLPLPVPKPASAPRSAKRGRARAVPAEARRQAILEAALSVFAEQGFDAARLDDVAARAGVAKGTLYLYFKRQGGAVRGAGPQRRLAPSWTR